MPVVVGHRELLEFAASWILVFLNHVHSATHSMDSKTS
ncbi:MAG: hypothetical protein QOH78_2348 [Verrucomicrobiota bacterium]|jgi:hypothetical protein